MIIDRKSIPRPASHGFSIIEIVVVLAIALLLGGAGISFLSGTGSQARKSSTDALIGLIEQARTTAITERSHVVLAIAEPGDLPAADGQCRVGLFKVPKWPTSTANPMVLNGVLLSRWQSLNTGVILNKGDVNGINNPLDEPEVNLKFGTGEKAVSLNVHAIAFNPRGGLHFPAGSDPVALRIAEGAYRNGKATANRRGNDDQGLPENRVRIGRVTARPYQIDR